MKLNFSRPYKSRCHAGGGQDEGSVSGTKTTTMWLGWATPLSASHHKKRYSRDFSSLLLDPPLSDSNTSAPSDTSTTSFLETSPLYVLFSISTGLFACVSNGQGVRNVCLCLEQ